MIHTVELLRVIKKQEHDILKEFLKINKDKLNDLKAFGFNKINLFHYPYQNFNDLNSFKPITFYIRIELNLSRLVGKKKHSILKPMQSFDVIRENFKKYLFEFLKEIFCSEETREQEKREIDLLGYIVNAESDYVLDYIGYVGDLCNIDTYRTTRVDYAVQYQFNENELDQVEKYIQLFQLGDVPHKYGAKYKLFERFNQPAHGSCYYMSQRTKRDLRTNQIKLVRNKRAYTVNFYNKANQLKNLKKEQEKKYGVSYITDETISNARGILRLEIQCGYQALAYLRKFFADKVNADKELDNPLDIPLDYKELKRLDFFVMNGAEISNKVISRFFLEISQRGDYYTKKRALWMIDNKCKAWSKKEQMKELFELVNPDKHRRYAIWEVRNDLEINGLRTRKSSLKVKDIDNLLKEFDKIGVNVYNKSRR